MDTVHKVQAYPKIHLKVLSDPISQPYLPTVLTDRSFRSFLPTVLTDPVKSQNCLDLTGEDRAFPGNTWKRLVLDVSMYFKKEPGHFDSTL